MGLSFSKKAGFKPPPLVKAWAIIKTGRGILCIYISFLIPLFSFSQNNITSSQFLATALKDEAILYNDRLVDFLKNTDHKLPWAEELEFRTETDEMDLNRQEYLMRFRYRTKAEINAHRNLHQSDIQLQELEKKALFEEVVMGHYFLLVQYVTLHRQLDILKQQQLVAVDKLNVLRKKAAALADVDVNDLLNAENKNHELELEIMEREGALNQIIKIITTIFNSTENIQLDTSNFLDIIDIKEKRQLLSENFSVSPILSERRLQIEKTELEQELEKAKNNWQVDYVQFKVAGRDKVNFAREWSFGLGMEIPLKDANKLSNNKIMLERLELENKLALQQLALAKKIQEAVEELELKIKMHELVARQLADSQLQYSFDNYAQSKDADPLVLLNIKSNILKRKADRLAIEKDIYSLYLEIVELTGKAVEMPLRNYLSKEWDIISVN